MRDFFVLFACTILLVEGKWDPWWKLVVDAMDNQTLFTDACLSVGRKEREFVHCIGNTTMDTQMPVASSSKIVAAMPFYEAVLNKKAKLHDFVSDWLDYWTKNETDTRGQITLRHLVTFQSGYQIDPLCEGSNKTTLRDCVKHYYTHEKHEYVPGTNWAYNEAHLQILGAVMEKIYDQPIAKILQDGLKRYNMTNSYFDGGENPILAGSMSTTGNDYEQFLIKYLNYDILPSDWRGLIEGDYNVYPEVTSTAISEILELFVGHYGMTMWYECPLDVTDIPYMRPECEKNDVHSCPGLFGYWPIIDRRNNFWMQAVLVGEPILGCIKGEFFRLVMKPFVDAAMDGILLPESEWPNVDDFMKQYEEKSNDQKLWDALSQMGGTWLKNEGQVASLSKGKPM